MRRVAPAYAVRRAPLVIEESEEEEEYSEDEEEEEEEMEIIAPAPKKKVAATPAPKPQAKKSDAVAPKPKMASKAKTATADAKATSPESEAKTKATPKKDRAMTYQEMAEVLVSLGWNLRPKLLRRMAKQHKKLYARLVKLVESRRKATSFNTPIGRLVCFVPAKRIAYAGGGGGGEDDRDGYFEGHFASIRDMDAVMTLPPYSKREELPWEELVKEYAEAALTGGETQFKGTKDEQLFVLIEVEQLASEEAKLESKMHECVYYCEKKRRAAWLNTKEGRELLGPVVNLANIKKPTQEALDKELKKLEQLRADLHALFDEFAEALQQEGGGGGGEEEAKEEEGVSKKKRKADRPEAEEPAVVEKKRRVEEATAVPAPAPEKVKKVVTTPKPKTAATPAPEKKVSSSSAPQQQQAKTKATTPAPQKPVAVSKAGGSNSSSSGLVDITPELRDKILSMSVGELRALMCESRNALGAHNEAALQEVDFYKQYS